MRLLILIRSKFLTLIFNLWLSDDHSIPVNFLILVNYFISLCTICLDREALKMRGLRFVLAAIVGLAAAVNQCTPSNSGTCCQGYTYNDTPLQKRATAPVCDGKSIDAAPGLTPPTCDTDSSGTSKDPVCTAIGNLPQGFTDAILYCGNPKTDSGTVKGSLHVEIVPCPAPLTGNCFKLSAIAPPGTTLDNSFQVQISPSELTSDNPGGFDTNVNSQPVYVPFSLVYGGVDPCTTGETTVWIGFHTGEGGETCWAGDTTIPGGNQNWSRQFSFTFSCKDFCTSWCCCPLPPTIPDCPAGYSQSCPNQCNPSKPNAQCNLQNIYNPPGWTTTEPSIYAQKCCCKPPDTPQCASGLDQHPLDSGATCSAYPGVCNPLFGTIADCNTGQFNGVCCCCTPKTQCSAGTGTNTPGGCENPPAGQTCTSQDDGCGGTICCCQASGPCSTETAFGVPASCRADAVCKINTLQSEGCGRWGWYINANLNGGATPIYALYTGAGKNDLRKGKDVGSVAIQPCSSGSSEYCAFFTTTSGWVIVDAHVEADCDALSTRTTQNFPCAPGGYNDNGGGTCGSGDLPSSTWKSQQFEDCESKNYYVIFHAAVANNDPDCTSSNCGNPDPA